MNKYVIAAATVIAMTSFAAAQQNQTPSASKAGTTQSADENAKGTTGKATGTATAPGDGNGSSINSKKNEPQAVPPGNTKGN